MSKGLLGRVRRAARAIHLRILGLRRSAEPFVTWHPACPACGKGYEEHEAASIGSDRAPGTRFTEALGADRFEDAIHGRAPLDGEPGRVGAAAVRCPHSGQLILYISRDVLTPDGVPELISHRVLSQDASDRLAQLLSPWTPAIHDPLAEHD